MNNQAGIRFPIAITNAGKRISGTASIQRLLSPAEFGGWEIANGLFLYVPYSEFTVPARAAAIGGGGLSGAFSLAPMRRCAKIPLHCGSTTHHVHHPRRLPFLAKAGCLSRGLLPVVSVSPAVHCHSNPRCRSHLLDPGPARRFLETLEMRRLRKRSARKSKDAPLVPLGWPALPDRRFGDPLGNTGPRTRCDRLASTNCGARSGYLGARSVAAQSKRSVPARATRRHSSSLGCRLPIL
jgi:hypothetical protein